MELEKQHAKNRIKLGGKKSEVKEEINPN